MASPDLLLESRKRPDNTGKTYRGSHLHTIFIHSCLRTLYGISAGALLLIVTGCASLTPEQCRQGDWRQIGYVDGVKGLPSSQIEEHASACASLGIRPNLDAYLQGRQQGLLSYCQAENGFQVGRRGATHIAGDCPANMRYGFLQQYDFGRQIHALESELSSRRSDISSNRSRIRSGDDRIDRIRGELARSDVTPDKRKSLLSEFNHLLSRKENLVHDNLRLERQAADLEWRLANRLRELGR